MNAPSPCTRRWQRPVEIPCWFPAAWRRCRDGSGWTAPAHGRTRSVSTHRTSAGTWASPRSRPCQQQCWTPCQSVRPRTHLYLRRVHTTVYRTFIQTGPKNCIAKHFTVSRYTSTVFAVVICLSVPPPSVRLSQAGTVSEWLVVSSCWVLAWKLPSTYPTLCYREIWVSPKIRVLPSGTLSQTRDLDNFATVSQSCCQRNSSTVDLVDHTYKGRWVGVKRNLLTPILRLVVHLFYNFFLQLCSSWQDFDWHSVSRGPSAVAEFLVKLKIYTQK